MLNLSDTKQKEVVKHFKDIIATYEANNKDFISNLTEWWDRHLGEYSAKKNKSIPFKNCADVQTKTIQYSDSSIEARFNAALKTVKFLDLKGQSDEGKEAAQIVEDYINTYWVHKTNVLQTILEYFQKIIVEGGSFLKIRPQKIVKKVKKYSIVSQIAEKVKTLYYQIAPQTKSLQIKTEEKTEFVGAIWESVSAKDLIFENNRDRFKNLNIHKIYLTRNELIDRKERKDDKWEKVDELLEKYKEKGAAANSSSMTEISETDKIKNDYTGIDTENSLVIKIPFWEIWAPYNWTDNETAKETECYFIISADYDFLHFYDENQFFDQRKPFVSSPCYRIADRIIGQGLPQRMGSVNDTLDILLDQALDNNSVANTLNFLFVPSKDFDLDKLEFQNGRGIPVPAIEGKFKQLIFHSKLNEIQSLFNIVFGIAERLSLVADYSMGRESSINPSPTASGTAMLLQQFAISLDPLIDNVQLSLKEAMYQTFQCLYEFMPSEGIKFITGEGREKVLQRQHFEYIDEFTISILKGAVDMMVQQELQKATALLQSFAADPSGETNSYNVKRNYVRTIAPDLEKEIMRSPQERQMLVALQQKAMQLTEYEKQLQAREQELVKAKNDVLIERGMEEEKAFARQLDDTGIEPEKKKEALEKFRTAYLKMKMEKGESPEAM